MKRDRYADISGSGKIEDKEGDPTRESTTSLEKSTSRKIPIVKVNVYRIVNSHPTIHVFFMVYCATFVDFYTCTRFEIKCIAKRVLTIQEIICD